ncbi:MAG TPA: CocE/NonD family hydrolase [Thermomonospora sp.]|nr:CocE/NonD family hydrolase [Thermomonospora sp.]
MPRTAAVAAAASLTLVPLVQAPAAHAETGRTATVRSFDGVRLTAHFFPAAGLAPGRRAPTVMLGHGFGGRGETDPDGGQTGPLRRAGYNVVTWNARGFGSGGRAHLNYHRVEGRDSRVLIDWVARQPEALADRPGDPRLGMAGGSYGGGIQLLTAGLDPRVDVIVPVIAWNSLTDSLYPARSFKSGWARLLCLAGHLAGNRVAPQVSQGCATGLASGTVPPAVEAWIDDHDLDPQVRRIRIPTLLIQGTVDTLFPPSEAAANHRILTANKVPLKMVWYCGGHGECGTGTGPKDHVTAVALRWFDRYLKRDRSVRTGPAFEYIDQSGTFHGGTFPPPALPSVTTRVPGPRRLLVNDLNRSGSGTAAGRATNGLTIPLRTFAGHSVGAPRLSFTYQGRATRARTHVYAQLVDKATGTVIGNQATPIPVVLDGRPHTVTRNLEMIAWRMSAAGEVALQIIPNTALFDGQRALGSMTVSGLSLTLPRVRPGTVVAR